MNVLLQVRSSESGQMAAVDCAPGDKAAEGDECAQE